MTAWQALLAERPEAADDTSVSTLERKILQVLTPEQADNYAAGRDPAEIELADGRSLAELITQIQREDDAGLVFKPVIPCTVLDTRETGQPFAADETRVLKLRGADSDGSAAGGCGIPGPHGRILRTNRARSVFLTVRVVRPEGEGDLRIWPANDHPQPQVGLLDYGADPAQTYGSSVVVPLCDEIGADPCAAGDVKVRTYGAGAHVVLSVLGWFEPMRPAALSADPLKEDAGLAEKSTAPSYWESGTDPADIYYSDFGSDGNVGIGTPEPAARLHVSGHDGRAIIQQPWSINGATPNFSPEYPTLLVWRKSDYLGATLAIGNSSRFYLFSEGQTLRIFQPDGNQALRVNSDGSLVLFDELRLSNVGEGLHFISDDTYFGTYADARVIRMVDGNGPNGEVDGGIAIEGYTSTDGVRKPIMAIRGSGNVGIGTKQPESTLDVAGDIRLSGSLVSDGDICIGNCD